MFFYILFTRGNLYTTFWNISRQIKHDNANKFINILTGMETASCEVYIIFKTSASITMKYNKNDKSIVYKFQ